MFSKIRNIYGDLKARVIEAVQWAENELHGKSGEEKKKAVVRKLDAMIQLPFYLEWADDLILGYLVDLACRKLNWLTGWDFAGVKVDSKKLAAVLEAPDEAPDVEKTVDERLEELYEKYGLKQEEIPPDRWEESIGFVLKWEGGFSDHPLDRGGPTNRGITVPVLKAAYLQGIVGHCDIKSLTKDEAKAIYHKNYWERYSWGSLSAPLCTACLDISVNHSPGGMARIIQRACVVLGHGVAVDGKYGPKKKAALWTLAKQEPRETALAICDMKEDYYRRIIASNPSQRVFLKGWMRRVEDLQRVCAG